MASFNCQTCWTTGERIMKTVWLYCLENIDHVRHNFCTVILSMCPCYKRCLRNVFTYCSRRSEGRSGHKGRPIIRCPKCDLRLQLNHWLYGRLHCLAEKKKKKRSRRIHYSNDLNLSKMAQEFAQSIVRHFCAWKENGIRLFLSHWQHTMLQFCLLTTFRVACIRLELSADLSLI